MFSSGTLVFAGFEVPVPFFLLRHPQGNVIVDGGNPLAVARDPHAHLGPLADVFEVHMAEEDHCVAQLQRLGADTAAVTMSCRRTSTWTTRARSGTFRTRP